MISESNIKDAAHAREEKYIETLESLVRLESPTGQKAAVDTLISHLEDALKGRGWGVERVAQEVMGDQLVARKDFPGEVSSLLLTHADTVWPVGTLEKMPIKRGGDKLHGPGSLDMKAGIALGIHAVAMLEELELEPQGPVTLLITTDEEVGSHHSRSLIERLAREHERAFVLEPGRDDGALKIGRKGVGAFFVHFEGQSAHAGNNPKDGASALRELAHFLLFVETLGDDEAETSVNLTVARGGSVGNVIPEEAFAEVDLRALKEEEGARVERAVYGYTPKDNRVKVHIEGGLNRPPMEPTEQNLALFEEAKAKMEALGFMLEGTVVGGGSDGNLTSALGVPTLDGLGSAGAGPHARFEHIRVSETLDRLALLTALLSK